MNRDQLIRALRKHARKQGVPFDVFKGQGKGSHYIVEFGTLRTTIQDKLNPGRIDRILEQLQIDPDEL